MYKRVNNQIEVYIVRLGGKSWLNRPRPWSIPKGLIDQGENDFQAATREFKEETGIDLVPKQSTMIDLSPIKLSGKYPKVVKLWAFEGDGKFSGSNTFQEEWPYKSGKFITSPESSEGDFYPISKAKQMVHSYQIAALDELEKKLKV